MIEIEWKDFASLSWFVHVVALLASKAEFVFSHVSKKMSAEKQNYFTSIFKRD